ncbi:MAG: ABC transporter permease [Chthonomonas sp.]|nr:ABC transporter permease [Chthonomonas sp.]
MLDLLRFAAPVALASLGESVGQRSGVLNIGLEGMMLTGAYTGMLATRQTGNPWVGVLAGIVAAMVLGLVQSYFVLWRQADQVVAGTAINLLALGLTGASYRRIFGESGELLSIPTISNHALIAFMLISVPALAWLLFRSKWGLAVRAAGEHPEAVAASGFSVIRLRLQASLIAAFYAGLAGAHLSIVNAASFQEELTKGRGFIAIAIVTFGRFNPIWAFVASLIIGGAEVLQYRLQAQGIQAPPQFFLALPYVLALLVLVFVGKGGRAPQALAVPYRKD